MPVVPGQGGDEFKTEVSVPSPTPTPAPAPPPVVEPEPEPAPAPDVIEEQPVEPVLDRAPAFARSKPVDAKPDESFLRAAQEVMEEQQSRFSLSIRAADGVDGDRHAKVLRLAEEYSVPVDFMDRNLDEFEAHDRKKKIKESDLTRKYPGLTKFLSDPKNAPLALDDVETLKRFEDAVKLLQEPSKPAEGGSSLSDLPAEYGRAVVSGWHGFHASLIDMAAAYGIMTPEKAAESRAKVATKQAEIQEKLPNYQKEFNSVLQKEGKDFTGAMSALMERLKVFKNKGIREALKEFLTDSAKEVSETEGANLLNPPLKILSGGGKPVAALVEMITALAKTSEPLKAVGGTLAQNAVFAGSAIVPSVAGTLAGTAVGGPVGAAAGGLTGIFSGSAFANMSAWIGEAMENRGIDTSDPAQLRRAYQDDALMAEIRAEAARKGLTQATIETLGAAFAGQALARAKQAGAGRLARAGALAKDTVLEMGVEAGGEAGAQAAALGDFAKVDYADAFMEGVASLGQSAVTASIAASVRAAKEKLRPKLHEGPEEAAEQAAGLAQEAMEILRAAQAMAEVGAAAKESKLFQRMPEKVGELVRAAGGDEQSQVYFDTAGWEQYWESRGLSPLRAAEQILGDNGKAYQEAKVTGSLLVIPLENYVEHIAATEHMEGLLESTRLKEDGPTFQEAREILQQLPEAFTEIANEVQTEEAQAAAQLEEQAQEVYRRAYEMQKAAGYSDADAKAHAVVMEQRYRARGRVMEESPLHSFEKEGIRLEREGLNAPEIPAYDSIDSVLNRIRDGDIPSEGEGRGKSLLAFLRDRGGITPEGTLGADLKALEADQASPAFKKLLSRSGVDLDHAAIAAHEAGYIAEADGNLLLNAISDEVAGSPVYSEAFTDHGITETRAVLEDLKSKLAALGVDLKAMSNEDVKKRLQDAQAVPSDAEVFLQQLRRPPIQPQTSIALPETIKVVFVEAPEVMARFESNASAKEKKPTQRAAFDEARRRFQGRTILNPHSSWDIKIEREGLKKAKQRLVNREQMVLMLNLDRLIQDSVYVSDREPVRPGIEKSHILYSVMDFEGKRYVVHIGVNEFKREARKGSGKFFYDPSVVAAANLPDVIEVEGTTGQTRPDALESGGVTRTDDSSRVNIDKVIQEINRLRRGDAYFQPGADDVRGMIQIRENEKIIRLFKGADLSTQLHEFSHLWLDEYVRDIAELKTRENLNEEQKRFLETEKAVMEFLGIESLDQIKTEHHEKWAETFEVYFKEGNAPSLALRDAFARFKSWLIAIYKRIRGLPNAEISPEIRSVFDRLLATEEQIQEAQAIQNQQSWPGVPERIQLAEAEAKMVAEEQLAAKVMREEYRKKEKAYREEREKVRAEVASEVHAMPVYQALSNMQRGTLPDGSPLPEGTPRVKLSKKDLVRQFGEARLKRLPRPYVYTVEGGVHPEVAAELFGFGSADEMLQAIENAPRQRDMIEATTEARMLERHGDMLLDGRIAEEAMRVIHSEKRAQMLRMRLEWLAKEKLPAVKSRVRSLFRGLPSPEFVKEQAERSISARRAREIRPSLYKNAEAKAAREALDAYLRGDFESAYEWQIKELLNHEMFRAAERAKEETQKIYEYMRGLEKESVQKRLGKAGPQYLEQINELLEQYEFRQVSDSRLRRRASLLDFVNQLENQNIPHAIPDQVILDSRVINYRELTMDELRGVRDAAKAIQHLAYMKDKLLLADQKAEKAEIAVEVADAVRSNNKPLTEDMSKIVERASKIEKGMVGLLFPVEQVIESVEGQEMGPLYRNTKRLIDRAVRDVLLPMQEKIGKDVIGIYEKFYSKEERGAMNKPMKLPGISRSLTKYEIIALAWYQGTESSRVAVLESNGLFGRGEGKPAPAQIKTALDTLTKKDWDFVQAVWDYNETLWPEISAAHERRTGLPLEKLPHIEVETKFGTYRGGYMPNKYDSSRTGRAPDVVENAYGDLRAGRYGNPKVSGRFMEERTGSGGQAIRLDKGVWTEHLHEVAYSLALTDPVNYVAGVLDHPEVRQAFRDTGNLQVLQTLDLWIEDVATGEIRANDALSKSLRMLRASFTLRKLGFNIKTGFLQLTSFVASIPRLGKRNVARGVLAYFTTRLGGNGGIAEQIYARSPYMLRRQRLFHKDISEVHRITKGWPVADHLKTASFVFLVKMQMVADHITYLAAYKKAIQEGMNEGMAAEYAERAVDKTQSSGIFSDRSSLERGTLSPNRKQIELVKSFTTLSSYMTTKTSEMYLATKRTNFLNPLQAINWAMDMAIVWGVEGLVLALVQGAIPDFDDDEDESFLSYYTKLVAGEIAGSLPFIKEFTSAFSGFPGGGVIGSTAAELARGINALPKLYDAITEQEEIDSRMIKHLNDATAIFTGHPSTFLNRIIDARFRELEGEEVDPREYLFGRTPKR